MSQITDIVLADGQTTPVNRTFSVVTAQSGTQIPAEWADRSGGLILGYTGLTMSVRKTTNSSYKVQIKVTDPELNAVDNTLIHTSLVNIEFVLPKSTTLQNRKDILAYAKNALSAAAIVDAIHNLSPAY